jgi:hypothetical protein
LCLHHSTAVSEKHRIIRQPLFQAPAGVVPAEMIPQVFLDPEDGGGAAAGNMIGLKGDQCMEKVKNQDRLVLVLHSCFSQSLPFFSSEKNFEAV